MYPWLVSHQQIYSNQFNNNTLPHAILVSGVVGSGKLEFANWLLHLLSCQNPLKNTQEQGGISHSCGQCKSCLLLKSNTYPDHLNLIAEKNSLGVDEVRHANGFLQKTAYLGNYKTVLINNAQTMTQAAANALLKTLEEPSDKSVIMLLTNDIEMLLPTIISRCRVIHIRPNVGESLIESISDSPLCPDSSTEQQLSFVNLTQLPELTNPAINAAFIDFKDCFMSYLSGNKVESQLLDQLLNNEHGIRWLEQITVNLLREKYLPCKESANMPVLSNELLNNVYKVIINGCKVMKTYIQANKQFVCEQLIMSISDVIEQTKINEQEI
jgi:DNA polymerase-3 subunit delta'